MTKVASNTKKVEKITNKILTLSSKQGKSMTVNRSNVKALKQGSELANYLIPFSQLLLINIQNFTKQVVKLATIIEERDRKITFHFGDK